MKKLLAALAVIATGAVAQAEQSYKINFVNLTNEEISFGTYRGIKVPSLCEDGFCWEEINVKFRPFNDSVGPIVDQGSVTMSDSDFAAWGGSFLVRTEGDKKTGQMQILPCSHLSQDSLGYFNQVAGKAEISPGQMGVEKDLCFTGSKLTVIIGK